MAATTLLREDGPHGITIGFGGAARFECRCGCRTIIIEPIVLAFYLSLN